MQIYVLSIYEIRHISLKLGLCTHFQQWGPLLECNLSALGPHFLNRHATCCTYGEVWCIKQPQHTHTPSEAEGHLSLQWYFPGFLSYSLLSMAHLI